MHFLLQASFVALIALNKDNPNLFQTLCEHRHSKNNDFLRLQCLNQGLNFMKHFCFHVSTVYLKNDFACFDYYKCCGQRVNNIWINGQYKRGWVHVNSLFYTGKIKCLTEQVLG